MKLVKRLCCPLLFFLFFVAAISLPRSFASASDTVDLKLSEGIYRYDYAYQVLALVNEERAKVNLAPLVMDADLTDAAMQRAAEICIYFEHIRPDGRSCYTACPSKMTGENIASGYYSPEKVMDGWMNSSGHKANILRDSFTTIGIGCFMQDSRLYWVQCFGSNSTTAYAQPANQKVSPTVTVTSKNVSLMFYQVSPVTFTEESKTLQILFSRTAMLDASNFDWSIADPNAASVDQSGVLRLKNGGTTTVTVSLKSQPSIQASIQVNAFYDLARASVSSISSSTYTGKPITFSPTVSFNGKTLTENTNYTVSFHNNTYAGTASFEINGLGLYQGTYNGTFYINKAPIRNASVSLPQSKYTWTGEPIKPVPTVTWSDQTLQEGIDYTLSWSNNTDQGNATLTVTGKGNFTGTVSKSFYIQKITITTATISPIDPVTYTGQPFTPEPTVTLNGEVLQKDRDYELKYVNNIDASGSRYYSKAQVRVIGIGKYFSEATQVFDIKPLVISGETIQLPDLSYSGSSAADYVRNSLSISYKGQKLTYDTDYYLYAYADSSTSEICSISIYFCGNYSGSRSFYSLKSYGRFAAIPDQTYTGSPITPKISIYYGKDLVEGEDYTLTWADNVEPGTARVTVTGKNGFISSRTLTFHIVKKEESRPEESEGGNNGSGSITGGSNTGSNGSGNKPGNSTGSNGSGSTTGNQNGSGNSGNTSGNDDSKPGNNTGSNASGGMTGNSTGNNSSDSTTGNSTGSNGSDNTPDSTTPLTINAPTLKASVAWNKVTLRWNLVANADSYLLYKKTNNGRYVKLKTISSKNTRTYTDSRVSVGSTYRYVIKACRTDNSSKKTYSSLSKAVIARPALSRPKITLRSLTGKQQISWKKVPGATGYMLYQRTGNGRFRKIKTLTSRSTSWSVRTKKRTIYSYKLVPYRKVNGKIKTGPTSFIKKARAR